MKFQVHIMHRFYNLYVMITLETKGAYYMQVRQYVLYTGVYYTRDNTVYEIVYENCIATKCKTEIVLA